MSPRTFQNSSPTCCMRSGVETARRKGHGISSISPTSTSARIAPDLTLGAKPEACRPYRLAAVLAVLFSIAAWAQTQLATVSGAITDPSGAVVPGARVTVVNQGTGLKRSVLTDAAGEYRFAGLPTGMYSLRISKPEFQSQIRAEVELTSAADVTINAQLAIGDLSQQATVSANAAAIDATTSTINGMLSEQSLADLPLDNRDLFSAVTLEPGVVPNPSSASSLMGHVRA